jgi:hypothetical protein
VSGYLYNLLRVEVDVNGDGNITRSEMVNALKTSQLYSRSIDVLKLWCQSTDVSPNRPTNFCYENFNDVVQVSDMFRDAMSNFNATGTFDGSGIDELTSMQATYPSPGWNITTCKAFDRSVNPNAVITASWKMAKTRPIKRTCGYVNGILDNDFSTSDVLTGAKTTFQDNTNTSILSNKRVYCIAVEFCKTGYIVSNGMCYSSIGNTTVSPPASIRYECAVGLVYDGTPTELRPKLTRNGIVFEFMDTSSSESKFDIYVGDFGSEDADKTHVVSIPVELTGCGRSTNPISFTDEISSLSVGQIVEYGITSTQQWVAANIAKAQSPMFTFPYRIPFLVQVVAFKP